MAWEGEQHWIERPLGDGMTDMPDVEVFWKVRRARRERDVDTLIEGLEDAAVAGLAADYLAEIDAVSSVPALLPLLERADPQHRASAVLALGKLKYAAACPELREIVEHDDVPWVRACAITALGELGCAPEDLLLRALEHDNSRIRGSSVEVLARSGSLDAIPALVAARKRDRWFTRGSYRRAIRRIRRRASGRKAT